MVVEPPTYTYLLGVQLRPANPGQQELGERRRRRGDSGVVRGLAVPSQLRLKLKLKLDLLQLYPVSCCEVRRHTPQLEY